MADLTSKELDDLEARILHGDGGSVSLDVHEFRALLAMARRTLAAEAECERLREHDIEQTRRIGALNLSNVGLERARDSWRKRCREQREDHASVWEMHLKELDATVARAEQAESAAARRLAILRSIEWRGDNEGWECCPACRGMRGIGNGHAPDCALWAEVKP